MDLQQLEQLVEAWWAKQPEPKRSTVITVTISVSGAEVSALPAQHLLRELLTKENLIAAGVEPGRASRLVNNLKSNLRPESVDYPGGWCELNFYTCSVRDFLLVCQRSSPLLILDFGPKNLAALNQLLRANGYPEIRVPRD